MTLIELLQNARARLAKRNGWVQHEARRERDSGNYGYCMTGALEADIESCVSVRGRPLVCYAEDCLVQAAVELKLHMPINRRVYNRSVVQLFNDARGRRKREVLAVYDHAIAQLIHYRTKAFVERCLEQVEKQVEPEKAPELEAATGELTDA